MQACDSPGLERLRLIAELADNPPIDPAALPAAVALMHRIRHLRSRLRELDAAIARRARR